MRRVRGNEIGVVFQDPMTSLNPTMTIGNQITESVRPHRGASRSAALERAAETLDLVGMPRAHQRLDNYPHQLSGGMRQRVMIAMALACEPKLLIADEPTTALDITIQEQILDLLDDLRTRLGMGILLITPDLAVIARYADQVAVMYAGRIVETGPTELLLRRMRHRYTEALMAAVPRRDQDASTDLYSIPGCRRTCPTRRSAAGSALAAGSRRTTAGRSTHRWSPPPRPRARLLAPGRIHR